MGGIQRSWAFDLSSAILGRFGPIALIFSFAFLMPFAAASWAGVGGSVSGTVTDQSGAVIPKAIVTVTAIDTGIRQIVATDDKGFYLFASLPVGHYDLQIESTAFTP